MAAVTIRPRALTDLAEAWAYIAEDSFEKADLWADRLGDKLAALARNPGMGRRRPELMKNLRSFPVGSYVVFYETLGHGVEIIRVLHGSRDIEALFESEP